MNWRGVFEVSKGVYWVGIRDWNRRLFDALIPLPKGTTYNSYLIVGRDGKALIDTVNPGFENVLKDKISKIMNPADIDYVIMNHAEPDHAGSIRHMMSISSKAKLVATNRGAKMAQTFHNISENRIEIVADGDSIDLGDKTLKFIEAPMLHWPETMFTYLPENLVLFPCDFFGLHVAQGLYDDQVDDLIGNAQRYFGEIMMPFKFNARSAIEKIKNLEIKMIAPSHGPIHRNPQRILHEYRKWSNGETKQKVSIIYVSMWNSTKKMIQPIAETLTSEGIEVTQHDLTVADTAEIAKDLVDSRALVLGTPTVLGGAHPLAVYATYLVKVLHPPAKYGVVLSSYGWSGGAVTQIRNILGPSSKIEVEALKVNGPPTENDIKKIINMGKTLAGKIKG